VSGANSPDHRLPLRHDPAFHRYRLARVISLSGSVVTFLALPVLVYQITGSSLWTGLVTVSEAVPYLCVGLPAGAVADRLDRRRLMVAADLAPIGQPCRRRYEGSAPLSRAGPPPPARRR